MKSTAKRLVVLVVLALAALLIASATASATPARPPAPAFQHSTDFIVGTFTIPANTTTENIGNAHMTSDITPPCQGCDIMSVTPDLTNTSGQSVNTDTGPMLHHIVLYQQGATDVSCPTAPTTFGMKRLFASGNERTSMPQVPGYGLYVEPTEQWAALTDLMNYSATAQTVQVRLHMTWQRGNALRPVTPVWLDVTGCGASFISVPAGPSHQSNTWTSTISGRVIGLGGHLHEYGEHIQATDTTTGTKLCDSKESQMNMPGGMVMVTGMSICVPPQLPWPLSLLNWLFPGSLAPIHQGDKIQLDSYYDAPMPELGMGIMLMYVYQG